jgi:outer membrane protein TolC
MLQEQHDDFATKVALQVRQYWLDIQETHKRILVTEKAIAQANENLRVNRDRYENGLSTNTEVLDAETLRTGSEDNHANALYDAVLATLRLKRSLGEL